MIYLKTIISAENEIKYIKLQLRESDGYVDKLIVCEFDHTHIGTERDFIFQRYLEDNTFSGDEKERIIYIQGHVGKKIKRTTDNATLMHRNERLFRGYFARHCSLQPNDVIISVDADEIIFRRCYDDILSLFEDKKANPIIQLQLYQFFYKPTYLWTNLIITAPTVCRVKANRFKRYPAQWRQEGEVLDMMVGCHFSWCLTIDEMVYKLRTYAHAADYGYLADRAILEDAIRNKNYPFDESVDFQIREVNHKDNPEYYPDTYDEKEFACLL